VDLFNALLGDSAWPAAASRSRPLAGGCWRQPRCEAWRLDGRRERLRIGCAGVAANGL